MHSGESTIPGVFSNEDRLVPMLAMDSFPRIRFSVDHLLKEDKSAYTSDVPEQLKKC